MPLVNKGGLVKGDLVVCVPLVGYVADLGALVAGLPPVLLIRPGGS